MRNPISTEAEQALHDLYYDKKNMFGIHRLYQLAKAKGLDISRRQVERWLKDQEVYQLFKIPSKAKKIRSTVLKKPMEQIGIDLVDTQKLAFDGFRYILTAIDLFSKKAWAVALRNKQNQTVLNGMKEILSQMGSNPRSIRSDNGSEFINKNFKTYLQDEGIKQVLSMPSKPQSNGQIERFNGVLKRLIKMSIKATQNKDWSSYLQQLVGNYNNTKHDTTEDTPNNIHKSKEYDNTIDKIRKKVGADKDDKRFQVGDKVRVKLDERNQDGAYWTKNIFTIEKVFEPKSHISAVMYKLEDHPERYYNHDFQKVESIENQGDEPILHDVSRLVRPSIQGGVEGFIVRWKNTPPSGDTFEPRKNLIQDIPKEVEQFEKKNKVEWKDGRFRWQRVRGRGTNKLLSFLLRGLLEI